MRNLCVQLLFLSVYLRDFSYFGISICQDTYNGPVVDDSCQLWFCTDGAPLRKMQDCADGLVYSKKHKVCVRRNGIYDDCSNGLLLAKFGDPCGNNQCRNGVCLGSDNGQNYICSCYPGYAGVHCEIDIDECQSDPCKNGGRCVDDVNGYVCQCPTLSDGTVFTGINCETAVAGIEEKLQQSGCKNNPFINGGLCVSNPLDGSDNYTCICNAGFTGINCETAVQKSNACDSQPCKNGGECSSNGEVAYTCKCPQGYIGINCQIETNPCTFNPCLNGGKCTHAAGQYRCHCNVLFTGKNCQIDLHDVVESQCREGETLIPHPDFCQLYFNCSQTSSPLPNSKSRYINECTYPQLFNIDTKQCDPAFAVVNCGDRKEIKSGCDYLRNQYAFAHGRPCNLLYPSCESKPNGLQMNEMRKYRTDLSPYYIVCFKERLIGSGMCGTDGLGERMMFQRLSNPSSGECKSLYKIPKGNGGRMPSCNGANFDIGVINPNICDKYYVCLGGSPTVRKCPGGTVFHTISMNVISPCFEKSKVCPPCGNKKDGC